MSEPLSGRAASRRFMVRKNVLKISALSLGVILLVVLLAGLATVSIATTHTQNVATSSEPVPPAAPTASAGPDRTVSLGSTARLDGSKSSNPDGDKLTYAWSIVDKPASSTAKITSPTSVQPTFVPDRMGTYKIQLVVKDGTKKSAPDIVIISMHPTNPSP